MYTNTCTHTYTRAQAVENAERVAFRHDQYDERIRALEARRQEEEEEEREREARLEALRQQVQPRW